ncbi:MAG: hypothetical protein AB2A00_20770 [Myxococcota bacterium]
MTVTSSSGDVAARLKQWVEARPWLDANKLSPKQLQQASRELHVGLTELLKAREEMLGRATEQLEQAGRSFQTMRDAAQLKRVDQGGVSFTGSPAMARFQEQQRPHGVSLQEAHALAGARRKQSA